MRTRGYCRPILVLLVIAFMHLGASGSAAAETRVFEKPGLTVEALVARLPLQAVGRLINSSEEPISVM
jgi:hypothetical protein